MSAYLGGYMIAKQKLTVGAIAIIGSISGGVLLVEDRYLNAAEYKEDKSQQEKFNQQIIVSNKLGKLKWIRRDAESDLNFQQSQLRLYPNSQALKDKVKEKEENLKEIKADIQTLKQKE